MNIGNILKVADAIESRSVPGLGFNMGAVVHPADHIHVDHTGTGCGTIACISGWALALQQGVPESGWVESDRTLDQADWFGLSIGAANRLFYADRVDARLELITDKQAVRCLRNLAITGKVDWEAALKGDDPVLPPLPVSKALVRTTA